MSRWFCLIEFQLFWILTVILWSDVIKFSKKLPNGCLNYSLLSFLSYFRLWCCCVCSPSFNFIIDETTRASVDFIGSQTCRYYPKNYSKEIVSTKCFQFDRRVYTFSLCTLSYRSVKWACYIAIGTCEILRGEMQHLLGIVANGVVGFDMCLSLHMISFYLKKKKYYTIVLYVYVYFFSDWGGTSDNICSWRIGWKKRKSPQ